MAMWKTVMKMEKSSAESWWRRLCRWKVVETGSGRVRIILCGSDYFNSWCKIVSFLFEWIQLSLCL